MAISMKKNKSNTYEQNRKKSEHGKIAGKPKKKVAWSVNDLISFEKQCETDDDTRRQVFNTIVGGMEKAYSWLGEQVAEEMLYALASWNYNKFINQMGLKRHVFLYWNKGYLKSSLINIFEKIVDERNVGRIDSVTDASLRGGPVEIDGKYTLSEPLLAKPFLVCDELSSITTKAKKEEMLTTFLTFLSSGQLHVSIKAVSNIKRAERKRIEKNSKGMITFDKSDLLNPTTSGYTLKNNVLLFCATYTEKYRPDEALEDRLVVIIPKQDLETRGTFGRVSDAMAKNPWDNIWEDNQFQKHINGLRHMIHMQDEAGKMRYLKTFPIELRHKIEDELDHDLSAREQALALSYVNARHFYRLETSDQEMIDHIRWNAMSRNGQQESKTNHILRLLEKGWYTIDELMEHTKCGRTTVNNVIKKKKPNKRATDQGKTRCYSFKPIPKEEIKNCVNNKIRKEDA